MNPRTKHRLFWGNLKQAAALAGGLAAFLAAFTFLIHFALGETRLGADFYTFWLAGKAMILGHSSPYNSEVTLQSQTGIYGRPAGAGEDQVAFAYPPFLLLALIPTLWMTFDWAYAFWLALNIVGILSLLFFVFRAPARPLSLTVVLFYPVFICFMTGNISVIMAGIVILFFGLAARRESISPAAQILSAFLLAWAAAKPQFIWLFTIFILLCALKQRLKLFLGAYFGSLLALLLISFAFVPDWVSQWLVRIREYAGYVSSRPVLSELLSAFLPGQAAGFLSAATLTGAVCLTGWFFYRWWKGRMSWIEALAWAGLTAYLVHPHGIAYEQMIFLTPMMLWVGLGEQPPSRTSLFFWFGSLAVSWLAFAGGLAAPPGPYSLAADRSAVLFNAAWVVWLLLSKSRQPEAQTMRNNTRGNFQV